MMNRSSFICLTAGILAGIAIGFAGKIASLPRDFAPAKEGPKDEAGLPPLSRASGLQPLQRAEAIRQRLRSIVIQGDPLERTRGMLGYLRRLNREDFPASAAALRELHLPLADEEFVLLLTAWAKADRAGALDFAAADGDALRVVLNEWSSCDPEAAHAWVMEHLSENDPNPLLGIVLPALARTDETRALKVITELPREDRWYVFRQMAPGLARQEAQAVDDWLLKLPEEFRGEAVAQIVHELPPARVEEAMNWLQHYPDGLMTANLAGLFRALEAQDPERAREVFAAAPAGRVRQEAMRGLVIERSQRGRISEALELMREAPAEADDAMLEAWVIQAMKKEPRDVLEQVLQIQDPALREEAGRKMLSRWPGGNGAAAPAWLDQGPPNVAATMPVSGH